MNCKAIIFDVDGTLIPNNRHASPSVAVIEAIRHAQKFIEIIVATSRPYNITKPIIDALNMQGYAIVHGGARIISIEENKIVKEHIINSQDFQKISKILHNKKINFILNDDGQDIKNTDIKKIYKPLIIYTDPVNPMEAKNVEIEIKKLTKLAVHRIISWENGKELLTILNPLATKEHAVKEIEKLLKIKKEDIVGVGDGYNDIPLLLGCGYKIAMGNAVDALKNIADYIAPSVDDDGVVNIINKFVSKYT